MAPKTSSKEQTPGIPYDNIIYYNAGAGSGKTYTLTHLLADEIKRGIDPSEVIMTTFTVDASSDLRERSRSVLYSEGMFSAAARIDQALIGTVHSIGQRFISKYWYQLGVSPSMKVMDENSTQFYINSSLANLPSIDDLKLFHRMANVFSITTRDEYDRSITDRDFWKGMLESVITTAKDYRIDSLEESMNYSIEKVRHVINPCYHFSMDKSPYMATLKEVRDLTSAQSTAAAKGRAEKAKEMLDSHSSWDFNDFIKLLDLLRGLPARDKKALGGIENEIESLEKLYQSYELFELVEPCIIRIYTMAQRWRKEYDQFKKRNSIIDYHDMEQYFLKALQLEEVQKDIRSSYRCLMVDEFQDSNQVQVEIFSRLSELVERCYWCGDSKQAIYGFRGADTELTRSIVLGLQNTNKERVRKLPKSYRSLPKIVDLCNKLFTKALSNQMTEEEIVLEADRKDRKVPQIRVFQSSSTNKGDFYLNLTTLVQQLHQLENVEYKDIAILSMQNSALDTICQNLIEENIPVRRENGDLLSQKETVLLQNILTLVIDPTDELAKTHIYHLTQNDSNLGDIIDLRLEFLSNKQEQNKQKEDQKNKPKEEQLEEQKEQQLEQQKGQQKEQKEPKKGQKEPEHFQEPEGNCEKEGELENPEEKAKTNGTSKDKWLEDKALIAEILLQQPRWRNLTVSALIRSVILELNLRAILKSWGAGWQKREDNLFTLIEIASQYEQLCDNMMTASTVFGFINYLNSTGGMSSGDTDGVRLQTFHSSKGLQWKYVIITSLEHDPLKYPVSRNFCGVNLVRLEQPSLDNLFPKCLVSVIPDIFGSKGEAFTPEICNRIITDPQYTGVLQAKKREWARLLYVAMTRAQDSLIMTTYSRSSSNYGLEVMGCIPAQDKTDGCWDLFGIDYPIPLFNFKPEEILRPAIFDDPHQTVISAQAPECNAEHNTIWEPENTQYGDGSGRTKQEIYQACDYTYDLPKKKTSSGGYKDKFVAPSMSEGPIRIDPTKTKVIRVATGERFPVAGKPEMNLVGDCVHNAYACFNGDDSHDRRVVNRMIDGFQLKNSLVDPDAIVRSHRFLTKILTDKHGQPQKISREMEFIHHLSDQIVKGSIDLVWHYPDKVVIVDYKTFPGSIADTLIPESSHYAGRHKPQLEHYRQALSRAGKTVEATYIYYPVLQHLVEVR